MEPVVRSSLAKSTALIEAVQKAKRARLPTLLIATVRHPASRCLSQFYHFAVSRRGVAPTDATIIEWATRRCRDTLSEVFALRALGDAVDLFAVTERYAESVLALALLLDVSLGDVLYVRSKDGSTAHKDVSRPADPNRAIVPDVPLAKQSAVVQRFFASDFESFNAGDLALFRVANQRLDAFIDRAGRAQFEALAGELMGHLAAVAALCPIYQADGSLRTDLTCFWRDNGCAQECLSDYAAKHGLWNSSASERLRGIAPRALTVTMNHDRLVN
jgi:hypothetical protein